MNIIDVSKYGHETVLDALDGLAESDWHTPGVCGVWSVKDIVAHLASYECTLVDVLHSILDDETTPTLDRMLSEGDAFNDAEVDHRRDRSVAEVWDEYDGAHKEAQRLLVHVPQESRRQNGLLPWYGAEYDLEDFFAYTFYGHKREHAAQINVFRDQLQRATMEDHQ